jgi:hypothetical protein
MELIQVFDNFLHEDDIKRIKLIMETKSWSFGHESDTSNKNSSPFWFIDLSKEPFFKEYLKSKIDSYIHVNTSIDRVYANGQTYGQNGTYHQDSIHDNKYTFCLYLNGNETTDGSIIIKVPGDNRMVAIEPIENRAIYFPSNYFHKGDAFNKFNPGLRICIAWKLNLL